MAAEVTELEHMILAEVVYMDIPEGLQAAAHRGELTIGELASCHLRMMDWNAWADRFEHAEDSEAYRVRMTELMCPTSKLYGWKVTHPCNHNDSSGFVAYMFEPDSCPAGELAVIAFRGSEDIRIPQNLPDWYNNATTVYTEYSVQQREALEYIKTAAAQYKVLDVTGHSTGGNLALTVMAASDRHIRDQIRSCRAFNAPGFNEEFLERHQEGLVEARDKIEEYQNENDLVSSFLYNLTLPIIIRSTARGSSDSSLLKPLNLDHHLLCFLQLKAGKLVRSDSGSKNLSAEILAGLTQGLEKLPNPMLNGMVNMAFAIWNRHGIKLPS
jgi:hypothetical protein